MRRVLLAAALFAALGMLLRREWEGATQDPVVRAGAPLALEVTQGAHAGSVGRSLADLGLVAHPAVFRLLVYVRGQQGRLRAGEYALEPGLSLEQILDKLVRGEVARHSVTFPEGKNLEEMAEIAAAHGLDAAAFRRAAANPAPVRDLDPGAADLEGYLFPDTYDVPRRPGAAEALVARMVQRFRSVMAPELPALASAALTVRQAVTLASLVELETARADERPRVAAVFLNRLKKGMLLQTDPTVIYALRKAGAWDGNIRKKDLALDSPYNTYKRPGLPPGPIASPGKAALLAALHPADTRDLYFVSRNDGSHEFSETLAAHERAVDRYQRRRGADRPGTS